MADAVQTGSTATVSSVLDLVSKKGLQVINSWIRDFPELMYVGLYLPNFYKDGGKLKRGGLTYAEQKSLNFKSIGSIESDMTVNKNEVVWYEAGAYVESAELTAPSAASTTVTVSAAESAYFKAGDVVVVRAAAGSTTASQQATVVSVNSGTGAIVVDAAITAAAGDFLMFVYNLLEHGAEINRGVHEENVTPVRVYFQKFGGSVDFDSQEINQSRLYVDASEYVKSKFAKVINRSNNNFARAWYLGRNVAGTKSETQGIEAVIAEKEARDGSGSCIIDFTGVAAGKEKAKKLVEVINQASMAPVYTGSEVPAVFCNTAFITKLSEIMFDMGNTFYLNETKIEFGLTQYSSPFFRNVSFITSHTLDKLEPVNAVAYVFPKHLVSFKVPEFQSVDERGTLVKTNSTGYTVLKMPQVSADYVKYTAQMTIANIFAGQTFKDTYKKIVGF